jgi:diacylglycerol kinase family enzyme
VGRFTSRDASGTESERYFVNIADFGIGGEAVASVNSTTKAFGGFVSFFYGAVKTIFTYKGKKVKVKVDDTFECEQVINNVVIANGQYFGGGMHIAPEAEVDDGLFDILIIDDMTVIESLINISKLYKGAHVGNPKVKYFRGKTLIAESAEDVLIDVEGEDGGKLPARFDIMPGAIKVKVGG